MPPTPAVYRSGNFVRPFLNGDGLKLFGGTSGFISFAPAAVSGSQSYTLPSSFPAANGYALISTTDGTMSWTHAGNLTWESQTANRVFAAPDGSPGAPTFRVLGTNDFPDDGITYAKMQNVSATSRLLGRVTAGSGDPEEVTTTQALDFVSSTEGGVLKRGASAWTSPGTSYLFKGRTVYTSGSGTYTTPTGVKAIHVIMTGGGGGGGGCAGAASNTGIGQGGSAGDTLDFIITAPSATYAYVVGTQGGGGNAGNNAGANGGDTSFGNAAAEGGTGGAGGPAANSNRIKAGIATNSGSSTLGGYTGIIIGGGGSGFSVAFGTADAGGGHGGASFWGGGERGTNNESGGSGTTISYGAGGAGASTVGNTNRSGGSGAPGIIVIEEYY